MKSFIIVFLLLFVVSGFFDCKEKKRYAVGVGKSNIQAKIDLSDKLNPQILPDIFSRVLSGIPAQENPDSKAFQKQVVARFSQAIMDDPKVNYRVDLNEDGVVDPLLVVPEKVKGKGALYSLRVPDPDKYPSDPGSQADWEKIAQKESIELVELSLTFDKDAGQMAISANPNHYVYENSGSNTHYTQHYHQSNHSWLGTWFAMSMFSNLIFGPSMWGFGSFYGGYHNRYYRPHPTSYRNQRTFQNTFNKAPKTNRRLTTSGGSVLQGSRSATRTAPPKSIQKIKSRRAMAVRRQNYARRTGGFGQSKRGTVPSKSNRFTRGNGVGRSGGFGRSRSSSFGGGGMSRFGK